MSGTTRLLLAALSLSLISGCAGEIVDPVPVDRPGGHVGDPIGTGGLRRLSPIELEATVRDLLTEMGVDPAAAPQAPLPAPNHKHGFQNKILTGQLSFAVVEQTVSWAEEISEVATRDLETTLGCTPTAAWDGCVRDYTERLGRMAYRRPLTDDDRGRLQAVYTSVAAQTTPTDGARAVWEMVLLSPDLWYLSADTVSGGRRLAPHALAAHLSYGLWGTMPNAWLREQTERLTSRNAVREIADAMLDDDRAGPTIARFHHDWLNLARGASLDKDPVLYPGFDAVTGAAMEQELDAFVTRAVLEDRPVSELFSSREGYVNRRLEELYGLDPTSTGDDDWRWRHLGEQRVGILSRSLFLSTTAGRGESALVHRGVAVIEHLLCRVLSAPPNAIEEALPIPPDASSGKLAAVEDRAAKAQCSACHDTIDPLGVAFESFDAVGGWRETYRDGVPVEPSGVLETPYLSRPIYYSDVSELLAGLAAAPEVQLCYATKWGEWLTGNPPTGPQRAVLAEALRDSDVTIRDVILETVTSTWFMERAEVEQ